MKNKNFWMLVLILTVLVAVFIFIGVRVTPMHAGLADSANVGGKSAPPVQSDRDALRARIWELEGEVMVWKTHYWLGIPLGVCLAIFCYASYRCYRRFRPKRKNGHCMSEPANCRYSHTNHSREDRKPLETS